MARGFTGTDTGRTYEVGKTYSNGNGNYRANADGTFTNLRTGRESVGSSQADNVQWFGYDRPPSSFNLYDDPRQAVTGPGARSGHVVSPGSSGSSGSGQSSGPGNPRVATSREVRVLGPGGSGGLTLDMIQRGKERGTIFPDEKTLILDQWQYAPTTPIMVAGSRVVHDRGWSDAAEVEQRYGESEFMSPAYLYGWAVTGADTVATAKSYLPWGIGDALLPNVVAQWGKTHASIERDGPPVAAHFGRGFAPTAPTPFKDVPNPIAYPPMSAW